MIKATSRPETGPRRGGGPPPAVRYDTSAAWPPVRHRFDARCICTWAQWGTVYRIKFINAMRPGHPPETRHG